MPARLRRPLAAIWISLGLHAALIALVQVAPPAGVNVGEPAIEARLVPAHTAPVAAETPPLTGVKTPDDIPDLAVPQLAPSEPAGEAPPAAIPAGPAIAETGPAIETLTGESVAEAHGSSAPVAPPTPAAAITSAVDLTYYSVRDLDVQPRALREIEPDYPYDADRQRLSGRVVLQLKLEADGRVSEIDVVSSAPPGVFDESAIHAFRDARFAPAQRNGRAVRAQLVIPVEYDWEGRLRNP